MNIVDKIFSKVEEREEDFLVSLLIIFSIAIFIGAFASFNSDISQAANQEASIISQKSSEMSFMQRMDYLGSVFFPWVLMLSAMVIAREVWLYRTKSEKKESEENS